ncbi:uncharacterized protein METZ01_LOCUS489093, partial [marine metagenome]
ISNKLFFSLEKNKIIQIQRKP